MRLHPFATLLFGAGALLALVFVIRTLVFVVWWSDPDHRRQALEPWMTPGYIAHSWQVPAVEVAEALGLAPPPPRHPTLEELARRRGIPVEELIESLERFLAEARDQAG